ncbi:MAG TPA: hypothetical protein VGB22_01520 [candidate division Zixibacteria bacterium]|jgi:hypothetical protein
MRRTIIVALLAALAALWGGNASAEVSPARVSAIEVVADFMRTGDTTHLRDVFADSVLSDFSPDELMQTRTDWINFFGAFQQAVDVRDSIPGEVQVTLRFALGELFFALLFDDSDKIALIRGTVGSVDEPLADTSRAPLDTLGAELADIETVSDFTHAFDADSQFVRLVSLLSPT